MCRRPHEGVFGRPSKDAISSSRFSKPVFCGAGAGGAASRTGRTGGVSGATGGATASAGRRKAASSRCAISARFWSALDRSGAEVGDGAGGGRENGVGSGALGGGATRRGGAPGV